MFAVYSLQRAVALLCGTKKVWHESHPGHVLWCAVMGGRGRRALQAAESARRPQGEVAPDRTTTSQSLQSECSNPLPVAPRPDWENGYGGPRTDDPGCQVGPVTASCGQNYKNIIRIQKYADRFLELPFPAIICGMCPSLVWSPRVVNPIVWTWFGKTHTCLYEVLQLTLSESKPEEEIQRTAPPRDQKQDRRHGNGDVLRRNSAALKIPPELSGLHCSEKEENGNTQAVVYSRWNRETG